MLELFPGWEVGTTPGKESSSAGPSRALGRSQQVSSSPLGNTQPPARQRCRNTQLGSACQKNLPPGIDLRFLPAGTQNFFRGYSRLCGYAVQYFPEPCMRFGSAGAISCCSAISCCRVEGEFVSADDRIHPCVARLPPFPHEIGILLSPGSCRVGEHLRDGLEILPGRMIARHDSPMTGPRILLQFGNRTDQSGPEGIEVDVPEEFPVMGFPHERLGMVPVLEEVPDALVAPVEVEGVSRHQATHEGRQGALDAFDQKVKVIRHQGPGEAADIPAGEIEAGPPQEFLPVRIVVENGPLFDTPAINVVDGSGEVCSRSTRHAMKTHIFRARWRRPGGLSR
jgi:hypothetical protein